MGSIERSIFVFTGKFAFGPLAACQKLTTMAGGTCEASITRRTTYLVMGTFGSADWIQSSYGRKIEKVVEYKGKGCPIFIVAEDHWVQSLPKALFA